jgi:hypothetical protein
MFEALTDPDRDPNRPWLDLVDDEQRPRVLHSDAPSTLVWSSLAQPVAKVAVVVVDPVAFGSLLTSHQR